METLIKRYLEAINFSWQVDTNAHKIAGINVHQAGIYMLHFSYILIFAIVASKPDSGSGSDFVLYITLRCLVAVYMHFLTCCACCGIFDCYAFKIVRHYLTLGIGSVLGIGSWFDFLNCMIVKGHSIQQFIGACCWMMVFEWILFQLLQYWNPPQSNESLEHIRNNLYQSNNELQAKYQSIMSRDKELKIRYNQQINEMEYTIETEQKQKEEIEKKYNILVIRYDKLQKEMEQLRLQSIDLRQYETWNQTQIVLWIMSLDNGRFAKYEYKMKQVLKQEQVLGVHLNEVNEIDIKEWGIINFADKKYLMHQIQKLINMNEGAPTAYN